MPAENSCAERYSLTQDNDSHWYVIPADKAEDWDRWCSLPEGDETAWISPDYAVSIGGSPGLVTFPSYRIQ